MAAPGPSGVGREAGISLPEALLAILILFLAVPSAISVFSQFRTAVAGGEARSEGLETVRTVAWLLAEELSGGRPFRDWQAGPGDSVSLRAYRGLGVVSPGFNGTGGLPVCYRGLRNPNPEKDSVLLLGKDGRWKAHDLAARIQSSDECDGGRNETWDLLPPPGNPVLARVFENGSYHFADGALRYRRGRGGRQPITPERIESGSLKARSGGPAHLTWRVILRAWTAVGESVRWRGVAR
jgi:hypothetical protein